ncbi:TPA: fimbrial protein [Photobacterium damselae]
MNKHLLKSFKVATIVSISALSTTSYASDGSIDITGLVTDKTCDISINGGTSDASIVLPTVSTTALATAGEVAGSTQFNMELSNCSADQDVRAYFESNNVDATTGYLSNLSPALSGGADNVQVQIANKNMEAIDLRDQTGNMWETISNGSALLPYNAQYVAVNGASTAGDVSTTLVYSLEYK